LFEDFFPGWFAGVAFAFNGFRRCYGLRYGKAHRGIDIYALVRNFLHGCNARARGRTGALVDGIETNLGRKPAEASADALAPDDDVALAERAARHLGTAGLRANDRGDPRAAANLLAYLHQATQ
jgi:hypothetical protein